MATIAIFGGTGYAGGAIRDEALRRGHTVISISRKEADVAKVRVLNHSLFFNFLAGAEGELTERGYLFHNDFVIFDEAHTLESVAARHLNRKEFHETRPRAKDSRNYHLSVDISQQPTADVQLGNPDVCWI